MTQTDNLTETNQPEQPGNAWVRSTFYGLATRTVVVRCGKSGRTFGATIRRNG